MNKAFTHPLFAPILVLAVFGLGALMVALLLFGPGLAARTGPWMDTLLTACLGWNATTRHFRLDAVILVLLEPPLFAAVVFFFYADDLRSFLVSRPGRILGATASALFLALGASLLVTGEISASGVAPTAAAVPAPLRQGAPAPGFSLVDHRDRPLSLASLRGRPVVLTFFYANCHASCPILIQRLKALEQDRPGDIALVAVSLDPERDTPESLSMVAEHWALGERWHLLTGQPDAVRAVLRAYGVQWAPLPDGEIAHENLVLMIDRAGRLAFSYRGLAHPEERQARDLARLVSERS